MDNWTIHSILPSRLPEPLDPDRGGYTLTMREEAGSAQVLGQLAGAAMEPRRVHVGWGSFRNLDIAAARQSAWLVLLDINLHQFRVWNAVRAALQSPACRDAESFIEIVVPLLPHQPRLRQFAADTADWLSSDLCRPGSWLFRETPKKFQWIQRAFREERVTTGCIDMRATPESGTFSEIEQRMGAVPARQDVKFDTLYVSNLPWMLAQAEGFFGESHAAFTSSAAVTVAEQVRGNLELIARRFQHVVSATHLADTSSAGDLRWRTELLAPAEFLAASYWAPLAPTAAPYRDLA